MMHGMALYLARCGECQGLPPGGAGLVALWTEFIFFVYLLVECICMLLAPFISGLWLVVVGGCC